MTISLNAAEAMERTDTPADGMGAGYLVYRLAADFHALCCLAGPEQARQEMAEIINVELEWSARNG